MKKFPQKTQAERDGLVARIRESAAKLESAIDHYNDLVATEFEQVQSHLDEYNAILDEARDFIADAAQQIDDYINDRSEKWQESERGQAYREWAESISAIDADGVTVDSPNAIETPEFDVADRLEEEFSLEPGTA